VLCNGKYNRVYMKKILISVLFTTSIIANTFQVSDGKCIYFNSPVNSLPVDISKLEDSNSEQKCFDSDVVSKDFNSTSEWCRACGNKLAKKYDLELSKKVTRYYEGEMLSSKNWVKLNENYIDIASQDNILDLDDQVGNGKFSCSLNDSIRKALVNEKSCKNVSGYELKSFLDRTLNPKPVAPNDLKGKSVESLLSSLSNFQEYQLKESYGIGGMDEPQESSCLPRSIALGVQNISLYDGFSKESGQPLKKFFIDNKEKLLNLADKGIEKRKVIELIKSSPLISDKSFRNSPLFNKMMSSPELFKKFINSATGEFEDFHELMNSNGLKDGLAQSLSISCQSPIDEMVKGIKHSLCGGVKNLKVNASINDILNFSTDNSEETTIHDLYKGASFCHEIQGEKTANTRSSSDEDSKTMIDLTGKLRQVDRGFGGLKETQVAKVDYGPFGAPATPSTDEVDYGPFGAPPTNSQPKIEKSYNFCEQVCNDLDENGKCSKNKVKNHEELSKVYKKECNGNHVGEQQKFCKNIRGLLSYFKAKKNVETRRRERIIASGGKVSDDAPVESALARSLYVSTPKSITTVTAQAVNTRSSSSKSESRSENKIQNVVSNKTEDSIAVNNSAFSQTSPQSVFANQNANFSNLNNSQRNSFNTQSTTIRNQDGKVNTLENRISKLESEKRISGLRSELKDLERELESVSDKSEREDLKNKINELKQSIAQAKTDSYVEDANNFSSNVTPSSNGANNVRQVQPQTVAKASGPKPFVPTPGQVKDFVSDISDTGATKVSRALASDEKSKYVESDLSDIDELSMDKIIILEGSIEEGDVFTLGIKNGDSLGTVLMVPDKIVNGKHVYRPVFDDSVSLDMKKKLLDSPLFEKYLTTEMISKIKKEVDRKPKRHNSLVNLFKNKLTTVQ
jgi:hypothetical protein